MLYAYWNQQLLIGPYGDGRLHKMIDDIKTGYRQKLRLGPVTINNSLGELVATIPQQNLPLNPNLYADYIHEYNVVEINVDQFGFIVGVYPDGIEPASGNSDFFNGC